MTTIQVRRIVVLQRSSDGLVPENFAGVSLQVDHDRLLRGSHCGQPQRESYARLRNAEVVKEVVSILCNRQCI